MSMSQEEIEALMNGLDFNEEEESKDAPASQGDMSEADINDLIEETENINTNNTKNEENTVDDLLNNIEDINSDVNSAEDTNIDDILKELEEDSNNNSEENDENIDELISNFEETKEVKEDKSSDENIDDILSTIDDKKEITTIEEPKPKEDFNDIGKDWTDGKIQEGVFPLPAENDTKVVNQLSEVANDSEEQATKIMDVLSNILDYNNDIQNDLRTLNSFNEKQILMLSSLNQKFPNIEAFKESLSEAQQMAKHLSSSTQKVDGGTNDIFQAMELMQFNDINRQKIERVMSVIRKLSTYLNNLFEDDGTHEEVAVAKHIHGDDTADLVGDEDLESLIAEFNK